MTAIKKQEVLPPSPLSEGDKVLSMIDRVLANPDMPVEKLEQLFALHQKVRADNAKQLYYAAFSQLQADLPPVTRKGTGHNNKKYARFEDVMEAIRPHLSKHGFSISFRTQQPDGKLSVTGVLAHEAGHTEETTMTLPQDTSGGKNAVQAWGSSASYGKRYVLVTLLGIATDDDDDGRKAAGDTITEDQADDLFNLIAETQANLSQFLIVAKVGMETVPETVDGIKEALGNIKVRDFERLKGMLLKKKGAR